MVFLNQSDLGKCIHLFLFITRKYTIRGIERYIEVTRDIRVDLTYGHLFRPTTPDLGIKDAPSTSSAAESRLKGYLIGR